MYNVGGDGAGSDFATCARQLSDFECFAESASPIKAQFKFVLIILSAHWAQLWIAMGGGLFAEADTEGVAFRQT